MARIYSKVSMDTWGDRKFLALTPLRPSGQALWLYLLTGHFRTAIPGLSLKVGLGALSDRLGWKSTEVARHWREIERQAMATADWRAGVVWLPKGIAHNEPESPNVIKGWGKVVLPECALVSEALESLDAYLSAHLSAPFSKAFRDTFRQGSPNQEQEQEQYTDPPNPPLRGGESLPGEKDFTRAERTWATDLLRSQGRCPHTPVCRSEYFCIGRLIGEKRDEERRGLATGVA